MLPVHNQADHIEGVVTEYVNALIHLSDPHELILVTNGCRDRSPAICSELAERFPCVRAIDSERGGWGLAVKLGLAEARGSLLAYTNSARTTAELLANLLLLARQNPDAVVKASRQGRPGLRKLGSSLYNWQGRLLFRFSSSDVNGTPKIFPRKFVELLKLSCEDDLIDLEFLKICRRHGYPVMEVPVRATTRHGGRSTTSFRSAWTMYSGAYQMWRESVE